MKFIDDFLDIRNLEFKIARKLVNKRAIKIFALILFVSMTLLLNIISEGIANFGFYKEPNFLIGMFIPRLFRFFPLYLFGYIIATLIFFKILIGVKSSYKEFDEGQKGSSRFATRKEIDEQYRCIPIKEKNFKGIGGVPIARGFKKLDNGKTEEVMYIDDSPVNNLIIGTTRSGKGETFVVPMIDIYSRADEKSSLIINDPKGELIAMCKDTLEERGYDVLMLNLVEPINSMSYNPLELIKQAYKKGDIGEAEMLCRTLTYSLYINIEDEFWRKSAMSLVNALILAVCDECIANGEEDKITLYTVYNMLSELGGQKK